MRIDNVKIYTMENDGIIENGYICFENGKIIEIGKLDGEPVNGYLLPGLIDAHTHIGLLEDSMTFEGDDINETNDPALPQLRGIDAINPFDRAFEEARENGITCVAAGPGSANPIGGQFCILKTYGKRVDKMIIKEPAAIKFALGENPKNVYHSKNQMPETRMATASIIRENLYKALKYKTALEKANESDENGEPNGDEPEFDLKLESLLPVIKGELPAHFHAHRTDDIFTAIRIANEFKIKYVLIHCTEGHLIADELVSENAFAVVGPNLCDRSKPELKSLSFDNPRVLDDAGLKICITTDHPVIPVYYLPLCAALAVKSGMNAYNALKAITINPAEILGIDDKVGSIKVGKDADFVLYDGDPLEIQSKVKNVWINGEVIK